VVEIPEEHREEIEKLLQEIAEIDAPRLTAAGEEFEDHKLEVACRKGNVERVRAIRDEHKVRALKGKIFLPLVILGCLLAMGLGVAIVAMPYLYNG
jgi:hypothetical protein